MEPENNNDGGTGNNGGDGNGNNGSTDDNKPEVDPNKFEITPTFWQNQDQESDNNQNQNNQNNGNNNQNQNNGGNQGGGDQSASAFNDHVSSLNFGDFEMSGDDISNFVQSGDTKGLSTAITKHGQNVYSKVMQDTATLFKQNRETMMAEVRAEIASASGAKDDLSALHSALEVTRNPAVQPVAVAVMKQAMSKQGVTQAQGVEAVRQFFKAVHDDGAGSDQTQPGDTAFRGNNNADEVDWAKELSAI